MVRSRWHETLGVALLGAGLAWGQQPVSPKPAQPVLPAPVQTVSPTPVQAGPSDHIITVEEPGKPAQKCKVLKTWKMKDGTWAREVQSLDTGEVMTIVEGGSPVPSQSPGVGARFQSLASRIFHRHSSPGMGVPVDATGPVIEGPMMAMPSAPVGGTPTNTVTSTPAPKPLDSKVQVSQAPLVPVPVAGQPADSKPATTVKTDAKPPQPPTKPAVGVAQPSDWRKSWGIPDDHQTKVPGTANYNANVPARPTLPLANYNSTYPSKPATPAAPSKEVAVKKDQPPAPKKIEATVKPEATAQTKPAAADLPKSEVKKPDPLRSPEQFTRRPLDNYSPPAKSADEKPKPPAPEVTPAALASKTPAPAAPPPPIQQVSVPATLPPAAPVKPATPPAPVTETVAVPASNNKPLPAGAQSVLAAGYQPGQVVYIPVPTVTLPSGYRPQPPETKIPQAPQPNVPPQVQQQQPPPNMPRSMQAAVVSDDSLVNAFSPNEQEVAAATRKMNPGQTAYVNNAFATQAAPQQTAQYNGMPMGQGMYPNGYQPGYQAPMYPNMYAQGRQFPMNYGMPPASYAAASQVPYPPNPYNVAAPGLATVSNYAPANTGVMPASYNQPAMAYPPMPPASTLPSSAREPNLQATYMLLRDAVYPSQREWAADSLTAVDWRSNPQVVQALLSSAREDSAATVRAGCVRCLVKMNVNTPPVLAALQGLKNDADPRVRQEVEQALTAFGQAK